jgi:hypothetical protein
MPAHILHLDPQGARLYACSRRKTRAVQDFADASACGAWLAARPPLHLWLLADFAEEAFVLESLPRLGRADRRALLARKLARQFPETPYRAVYGLGRAPDRPEQEACLLLALTRPALLDPWLAALRAAGARLDGLTSAAQLAAPLMQRLALPGAYALLLSGDAKGVRQSLVRLGGRPITLFSRRSAWPAAIANETEASSAPRRADTLAADLIHLRAQLEQGRFLPRGAPLPTVLILPTALRDALGERLAGRAEFQLMPEAVARIAQDRGVSPDTALQPLLVHLLARQPPRQHLLPEPLRLARNFALRQRLWRLAAAAGSLAALLASAAELENASAAQAAGQRHAEARARLEAAIARETPANRPALNAEDSAALLAAKAHIDRQAATPGPLLHALGQALAETPDLRLARLDWQNGTPAAELDVHLRGPAAGLDTAADEVPEKLRGALTRAGLALLPAPESSPDAPLHGGDAGPDRRAALRDLRLRLRAAPAEGNP